MGKAQNIVVAIAPVASKHRFGKTQIEAMETGVGEVESWGDGCQ